MTRCVSQRFIPSSFHGSMWGNEFRSGVCAPVPLMSELSKSPTSAKNGILKIVEIRSRSSCLRPTRSSENSQNYSSGNPKRPSRSATLNQRQTRSAREIRTFPECFDAGNARRRKPRPKRCRRQRGRISGRLKHLIQRRNPEDFRSVAMAQETQQMYPSGFIVFYLNLFHVRNPQTTSPLSRPTCGMCPH